MTLLKGWEWALIMREMPLLMHELLPAAMAAHPKFEPTTEQEQALRNIMKAHVQVLEWGRLCVLPVTTEGNLAELTTVSDGCACSSSVFPPLKCVSSLQ